MAEFPIFPVHTDKFLSDTLHMTAEEVGAYCLILFAMWREGGRLPQLSLLKYSRMSPQKWRRHREVVCRPLTVIDGIVSQKRLEDIRLKVKDKRAKAQAAINKRWSAKKAYGRNTDVHTDEHTDGIRNGYETDTLKISKKVSSLSTTSSQSVGERRSPSSPMRSQSVAAPQQAAAEEESPLAIIMRRKGWIP